MCVSEETQEENSHLAYEIKDGQLISMHIHCLFFHMDMSEKTTSVKTEESIE